ncbi:hypothetical protein EI545_08030 [Tabrizicola piscis]|uniref:Uncharacterized protein n=1 Tax=Tabrizicola piscis TaxID=2494374 RepID=A0A3S8U548_9RHOB|nr:hypothetical protein EI545_08030 [Tabrizicola piscis]
MRVEDKERRHPNRAERRALRTAELSIFVKKYGRRAQKNADPNDRTHDRDVEKQIRQMDPIELDRLLREDEE